MENSSKLNNLEKPGYNLCLNTLVYFDFDSILKVIQDRILIVGLSNNLLDKVEDSEDNLIETQTVISMFCDEAKSIKVRGGEESLQLINRLQDKLDKISDINKDIKKMTVLLALNSLCVIEFITVTKLVKK